MRNRIRERQNRRREQGGGVDELNNMDEFYHADVDQSLTVEPGVLEESVSKSDPTIYLKVSSILFVRAGLFLSQVSSIPSSNIQILIFQNIIDIAVNTVIYSLVGYLFAFGKDFGTFIGIDGFLGDKTNRSEFAEGWLIIIAVSGLLVAAVGDRISFFSSLIINILISGLVFPLFIHWALSESGWMRVQTFTKVRVSFKDYSYSCLIHMSGGCLAFLSILVLNKRLLRFKDMDVCSIPDNGPSLTLFGNFFMIIGFFGMGIPTEKYLLSHLDYNFYGVVMTNMLLSVFGSITTALLLTFSCAFEPLHKWTSMRSIQAGISGIAVIAGGADVYQPLISLAVGICNGVLFFFVSFLVSMSPIEDYSNIIACHFVSGLLGTILPPILGVREGFSTSAYYTFIHITWQIICDLAILGVIISIFGPIAFFLDYFSVLRSWDEDVNHRRAMFASKNIRNKQKVAVSRTEEQTVNYLETDYKPKEKSSSEENRDSANEGVNVLFEKKNSEIEQTNAPTGRMTPDCFQKVYAKGITYEGALNYDNDRYLINYVVNSKPLTFFEEVVSEAGDSPVKEGGDSKNSKLFDIKLIKGIRNISDSKLFLRFKNSWPVPKKRTSRNKGVHELRVGSMSNIWFPNPVALSIETEV